MKVEKTEVTVLDAVAMEIGLKMGERAMEYAKEHNQGRDPKTLMVGMMAHLLYMADEVLEFPPEAVVGLLIETVKCMGYEWDEGAVVKTVQAWNGGDKGIN